MTTAIFWAVLAPTLDYVHHSYEYAFVAVPSAPSPSLPAGRLTMRPGQVFGIANLLVFVLGGWISCDVSDEGEEPPTVPACEDQKRRPRDPLEPSRLPLPSLTLLARCSSGCPRTSCQP
jgi:hypothetical protein